MKKAIKVEIIKWYIRNWCAINETQTLANQTNNLNDLEKLVMKDRCGTHYSDCATCWYYERGDRCKTCENRCNYTFPYGYWYKIYNIDRIGKSRY